MRAYWADVVYLQLRIQVSRFRLPFPLETISSIKVSLFNDIISIHNVSGTELTGAFH